MKYKEIATYGRIDELKVPDDEFEVSSLLQDAGYEVLGTGDYGEVYHKSGSDYVLKVFANHDKAYSAYVDLVLKNQSNPHFPKIKKKLVRVNDQYSAVRMEQLSPIHDEDLADLLYVYVNKGQDNINDEVRDNLEPTFQKNPELRDACDLIHALIKKSGFYPDVHTGNIMKRGSTIVFIDPIRNADSY